MREMARQVQHDNSDGSPAYFDPDEGTRRYEARYPLSRLTHIMSPARWQAWLRDEIENFTAGLGHDRGYTKMLGEEIEEPVVLSEWGGKTHVWDGFHRIAAAFTKGDKTIKAIVGTR